VFDASEFAAVELAAAKGTTTISVCLPAHDEAATIGDIVRAIRRDLVEAVELVDEVLVIDDASTDDTAAVAQAAGANVISTAQLLPELGVRRGKGEALWKSVAAAAGDLIVWLDADLAMFSSSFVTGLLGPLLTRPDTALVKGFYERPGGDDDTGGGRVTELVARPLLATWFPELSGIFQPLGGEYAASRHVLERVRFAGGYGVDIGLLIDIANGWGVDAIAQVDLGVRSHRNRPLEQLGPQALAVMTTALRRAGIDLPADPELVRPDGSRVAVDVSDRPPLAQLLGRIDAPPVRDSGVGRLPSAAPAARLAELAAALGGLEAADASADATSAEAESGPPSGPDDALRRVAKSIARRRARPPRP
jgi:glucosyl-3-phosphoglycerate synthase